jgi:hypothetical protein
MVPVYYMELILTGFERGKSITWGNGSGGPWKSRLPMPLVIDLARLKTITYRSI